MFRRLLLWMMLPWWSIHEVGLTREVLNVSRIIVRDDVSLKRRACIKCSSHSVRSSSDLRYSFHDVPPSQRDIKSCFRLRVSFSCYSFETSNLGICRSMKNFTNFSSIHTRTFEKQCFSSSPVYNRWNRRALYQESPGSVGADSKTPL